MTIEQMLQKNPAPWRYVAQGGLVHMIDAFGQKVELFTMLDYCVISTLALAPQPAKAETAV